MMRRILTLLAMLVATCMTTLTLGVSPSSATGLGYTPGPGASYNTTNWWTKSRSASAETLYVSASGLTVGKVNSCYYGSSIWYTDTSGVRRNIYWVNNGCTWGPVWQRNSPYFTAKRGTTVAVTYRWDGVWYPGMTFRIS